MPLSAVTRSAARAQQQAESDEKIESALSTAARVQAEFEWDYQERQQCERDLFGCGPAQEEQSSCQYEPAQYSLAPHDSLPSFEDGQYLLTQPQYAQPSTNEIPAIPLATTEGIFAPPVSGGWEPNQATVDCIDDFLQENASFLDARKPFQLY
jgi:hypothetical protein